MAKVNYLGVSPILDLFDRGPEMTLQTPQKDIILPRLYLVNGEDGSDIRKVIDVNDLRDIHRAERVANTIKEVAADDDIEDKYEVAISYIPVLAALGKFARENYAYSYRSIPFLVGNSTMAYNPQLNEYMITTHGNQKLGPRLKKHCAEMFSFDDILAVNKLCYGQYYPLISVTVGTSSYEEIAEVTGMRSPTLCKCPECRQYPSQIGLEVPDTMLDVSCNEDVSVMEVRTFGEVKSIRNKPDEVAVARKVGCLVAHSCTTFPDFSSWHEQEIAYRELREQNPTTSQTDEGKVQLALQAILDPTQNDSPHRPNPSPRRRMSLIAA